MRPLEIVLSCANLLAFASLVIPLPSTVVWMRAAAPIALLIAAVQVAAEGWRWQMVPAYALGALFFLMGLLGAVLPEGVDVTGLVAIPGIVAVGVGALIISIALPVLLPVFHFPTPTGPYAIGTMTYHWVDTSRRELFTTDPTDQRELMVQVWYPARSEPSAPHAPYIQDADAVIPTLARLYHFPAFFLTHFRYVTTNAVPFAPIATDNASYPVLIFLSGLNGFRQMNTFQVEELVSHGYIVAGIDQPGAMALVRFPDGRQIAGLPREQMKPLVEQSVEPLPATPSLFGNAMPNGIVHYFAEDIPFSLDQLTALNESDPNNILTGRLDLGRAGIFGVSLGGINAAEACLLDSRLRACLIMDAYMSATVVKAGLKQPAMWMTRDADTMRLERQRAGGWSEKEIEQHQTTMRQVYEELPGDGYFVQIPKMFHLNLTDVPYWSPITSLIGVTGPVNSQRIFNIINAYSVAFFNKHLKGRLSPLLDGASKHYPEVIFETRQPQSIAPMSASRHPRITSGE